MKLSDEYLTAVSESTGYPEPVRLMARQLLTFRQAEPAVKAALEELLELRELQAKNCNKLDLALLERLTVAEKVVEAYREVICSHFYNCDVTGALEAYDEVVKND